jgi:hypothetical protein
MVRKSKQAEKEARRYEERVRFALAWSGGEPPRPDVPPPTDGSLTTGWTFNVHTQRVDVACSGIASHAIGRTDRTTSQRALALYSTRKLALQALRAAMECKFAEELARIDVLLEAEEEGKAV